MDRRLFFAVALTLSLSLFAGCASRPHDGSPDPHERARREMVESQIKARGITDRGVIQAMLKVFRHEFVPQEYESLAYTDHPLPIGEGQTISQPYIVALMTQSLDLEPDDRVLEIGTGSGYQAAVLSLLADTVYTIEIVQTLADSAAARLRRLGYDNVRVRCGDGFLGWPEQAPFDAVIVTCAPATLPEPLVAQLADGARMVVPLGDEFQVLTLYVKEGDSLKSEAIAPVIFVPMKGLIEER